MRLLSHKQKLTFVNQSGDGHNFALTPKPELQNAPDWIRETGTFKAAVKAGFIVEVAVLSPVAEERESKKAMDDPDDEPKAAVVAGLAGNGEATPKRTPKVSAKVDG